MSISKTNLLNWLKLIRVKAFGSVITDYETLMKGLIINVCTEYTKT